MPEWSDDCRKFTFRNPQAAWTELLIIRRQRRWRARSRKGRQERIILEVRPYKCLRCHLWHLTSQREGDLH